MIISAAALPPHTRTRRRRENTWKINGWAYKPVIKHELGGWDLRYICSSFCERACLCTGIKRERASLRNWTTQIEALIGICSAQFTGSKLRFFFSRLSSTQPTFEIVKWNRFPSSNRSRRDVFRFLVPWGKIAENGFSNQYYLCGVWEIDGADILHIISTCLLFISEEGETRIFNCHLLEWNVVFIDS